MADQSREYRLQADECRRQAEKAWTRMNRRKWLRLADEWLMLAETTEIIDRMHGKRPMIDGQEAPAVI